MKLLQGNNLELLGQLPDNSVDAVVTDPPYGLGKEPDALAMLRDWLETGHHDVKGKGFMGKEWDAFVPQPQQWREIYRVLKPGGHVLAFAGTRTQDLMALGLRLAGFEIRDLVAWVYGSGFPKSLDVSKALDKKANELPVFDAIRAHIREWRDRAGLTNTQLNAAIGSSTNGCGMARHWTSEEGGQHAIPSKDQWHKLKALLGWPDCEFDAIYDKVKDGVDRPVIGHQRGTALAVAPGKDNDRSVTVLDITAPATDAARQWQGWGTALKPALEPITLARKPLESTVAENVLKWHTGAVNVDGCRVASSVGDKAVMDAKASKNPTGKAATNVPFVAGVCTPAHDLGRWPANLIHDGSEEVTELFPDSKTKRIEKPCLEPEITGHKWGTMQGNRGARGYDGEGSAARFFYCAKASKKDRDEGLEGFQKQNNMRVNAPRESEEAKHSAKLANFHPTVKPTDLMRYLCRLITPPGGVVLDPWMGSGSTGKAAKLEGFEFIGMEMDAGYFEIAKARIEATQKELL